MSDIYKIHELEAEGCIQFEGAAFVIGMALHNELKGNICPGCHKNNNNCSAQKTLRRRYAKPDQPTQTANTETVRQEAARLGISIGEVRRRRQA